ncbi:hypothetical protein ASC78_23150 [Variovorax sp. Root318D1]|nr:hypothetical protein ASC78_23150 [Variovorax sp. Root318D1]
MTSAAHQHAYAIFNAATPVIRIHGIGGKRWKRNVAQGARVGPWLQAEYDILDTGLWKARTPCLYLVAGNDGVIRYVGTSRNRLADRWRVSPALDAEAMTPLSERQLFHSQCWIRIEQEVQRLPESTYEVRCIDGTRLSSVLAKLGPPLVAFTALGGDGEGIVAGVERWMCNNQGPQLVSWNVAMTGR